MAKAKADAKTTGRRTAREGKAPPTTAERVRARRAALGLSQSQLGRLAGVHVRTVSGIECGRLEPSRGIKLLLATALGVLDPVEMFPELAPAPGARADRPRRVVLLLDPDGRGWAPDSGSLELAARYWAELGQADRPRIAPLRLAGPLRRAVEDGVEVVFRPPAPT